MAGRPSFQATPEERKLVEALAGYGIGREAICLLVTRPKGKAQVQAPISPTTLRKHFRQELEVAEVKVTSKVAEALVQTALDRKHPRHVAAAIFFLKARAGWSERTIHQHEGHLDLDLTGATAEELAILEKFLKRKVADAHPSAANDERAA